MNKTIPFFTTSKKTLTHSDIFTLINKHKAHYGKYGTNFDYYIGKHKILNRTQKDASKPNNKVVITLPHLTTELRVGYFSGEPVTVYNEDETYNELINKVLEYNDFQQLNSELDRLSAIYGHACMIIYLDEDSQIRLVAEDPQNCFVVYDNSLAHDEVAAIRYFEWIDDTTNEYMYDITVYEKDKISYYYGPETALRLIKTEPNYFKDIPVVEFMENKYRKGCYEDQISIVDAIELTMSNSQNEIDYFANEYLLLKNLSGTTKEDLTDMKNNRVFKVDGDGDAYFLNKNTNDAYVENTLNRLFDNYHKCTQTPDVTDQNFAGTASGVSLKYKLFGLEKSLSAKESLWRKSLMRALEIITNVINLKSNAVYDYKTTKLTFVRALPTNLAESADIVTKLSGTVSQRTLLSQLEFIENVDEEMEEIQKEKEDYQNDLDMYNDYNALNMNPKEDSEKNDRQIANLYTEEEKEDPKEGE